MSKFKARVQFELGLIDGDDKRVLESRVGSSSFEQRKSFDEYYVLVMEMDLNLAVNDLMVLAENFKVTVGSENIVLTEK